MLRAVHPVKGPHGIKSPCFGEDPPSDQEVATCASTAVSSTPSTPSSSSAEPELLRRCTAAWHQEGDVDGVDPDRAALLGYRFCVLLSLDSWPCCFMALTCIRMLAQCSYDMDDIEVSLGMAAAMMQSTHMISFTEKMGTKEKLLVALLHVYCAHSLVFDQFVHFNIWHDWLFAPFCSVKHSSAALRKVCSLRRWRFNVPADVLDPVLTALRGNSES
jgi:hypothetical protein